MGCTSSRADEDGTPQRPASKLSDSRMRGGSRLSLPAVSSKGLVTLTGNVVPEPVSSSSSLVSEEGFVEARRGSERNSSSTAGAARDRSDGSHIGSHGSLSQRSSNGLLGAYRSSRKGPSPVGSLREQSDGSLHMEDSSRELSEEDLSHDLRALRELSAAELAAATDGYSKRLGEGGFGVVYHGAAPLGPEGEVVEIAVKVLRSDSHQGFKEFQREIRFLGSLSHPNLVRLHGFCCDGEDWMIVYEYIRNRSVDYHLFSRVQSYVLSFPHRLKIAIGAAKGLSYLHSRPGGAVVMRDVKTSNILVDREFNAKLSDFGMARHGPKDNATHLSTGSVVGTGGYMAPEYISQGHLSERCDVYSFGVVLLELITGRSAATKPSGEEAMAQWVRKTVKEHKEWWLEVADPRLQGECNYKAVKIMVKAALRCTEFEPRNRPSMKNAVDTLNVAQSLLLGSANGNG